MVLQLRSDMTDEEIVAALGGVDSSDQWLAIENADDETKQRAQRLWDVEAGRAREAGEQESGEHEEEQRDADIPDGSYTFTRGDGDVLFVYSPGATDASQYVAQAPAEESGRTFDTGTIELRDGRWQRPVVTGNLEDEAGEHEGEQEVPPAPPQPYATSQGESEGGESEAEQVPTS